MRTHTHSEYGSASLPAYTLHAHTHTHTHSKYGSASLPVYTLHAHTHTHSEYGSASLPAYALHAHTHTHTVSKVQHLCQPTLYMHTHTHTHTVSKVQHLCQPTEPTLTVITPFLPIFSIAFESSSPTAESPLAEMVATCNTHSITSLPIHLLEELLQDFTPDALLVAQSLYVPQHACTGCRQGPHRRALLDLCHATGLRRLPSLQDSMIN